MRINEFNGIHSSNVQQDARRMHMNEAEAPKVEKVDIMRDTVEISSKRRTEKPMVSEEPPFELRTWLEQQWKHTKEKVTEVLLKIRILKTDEIDPERIQFNPYFVAELKRDLQSWVFFQKVKYRVHAVTRSLVKWFSEFMGGSSLNKKEEPKEEPLEKERYEEVDIEYNKTSRDESHLLSSYNKKGEPTKLTTKK